MGDAFAGYRINLLVPVQNLVIFLIQNSVIF
jgi:hypothetical protein